MSFLSFFKGYKNFGIFFSILCVIIIAVIVFLLSRQPFFWGGPVLHVDHHRRNLKEKKRGRGKGRVRVKVSVVVVVVVVVAVAIVVFLSRQ